MFPSHDAVVAAVPDYDRYAHLDELETWTDACAADAALYKAKRAGKDRVESYG